eukprot:GHVN01000293.1.p1 GENE.GHVN01000293.1~~GHVN01000293.1.p1  ORF type:complete len:145 (+),score=11.43 GHVN01000293.1:129-563(+)
MQVLMEKQLHQVAYRLAEDFGARWGVKKVQERIYSTVKAAQPGRSKYDCPLLKEPCQNCGKRGHTHHLCWSPGGSQGTPWPNSAKVFEGSNKLVVKFPQGDRRLRPTARTFNVWCWASCSFTLGAPLSTQTEPPFDRDGTASPN